MIHFRYHLVSLMAVFLALAIGVAMGATVIDKAIVDALRVQVQSAERRADSVKRENDSLKNERAQDTSFLRSLSETVIAGRLDGAHVQFIAPEGLDESAVGDLVEGVENAGGEVSSVLWLTNNLKSDAHQKTLRTVLDSTSSKGMWNAVYSALSSTSATDATSTSASESTTSTTSAVPSVEQFDALVDAGIFTRTNVADSGPVVPDLVILLSGPASPTASAEIVSSSEYAADDGIAAVIGEVWDSAAATADAGVGSTLAAIRNDEELRRQIATVDTLDEANGPLLLVLVSEAALAGRVGQYGYGLGARDGIVPGPA